MPPTNDEASGQHGGPGPPGGEPRLMPPADDGAATVSMGTATRKTRTWFFSGLLGLAVIYPLLLALGGEARDFAAAGLEPLPLVALALLAYAGAGRGWARIVALVWLLVVTSGAALISIATARDAGGSVRPVAVLCLLALLLGWLCLAPPVRRFAARVTPLDPASFVHAVALVAVVTGILTFSVPVLVQGAPPLLASINSDEAAVSGGLEDDLHGLLWIVPATVLAVGWPLNRSFAAALRRLGLVRPTRRQLLFGVLGGTLLVVLFIAINVLIAWLWNASGWPITDDEAVDELFGHAYNPLGALVIGVSAGLGEELGVRGVLQPRLGLLLSNLFFTALHAFQYNLDGLLTVFLVGLFLGVVRQRANTTTSALVHGVYDCIVLLLSTLAARHILF